MKFGTLRHSERTPRLRLEATSLLSNVHQRPTLNFDFDFAGSLRANRCSSFVYVDESARNFQFWYTLDRSIRMCTKFRLIRPRDGGHVMRRNDVGTPVVS